MIRPCIANGWVFWTVRPPVRRPADVRDERRRGGLPRLADELLVGERRFRLLVQHRRASGVEEADPGAVGVAVALHLQRIGRVQQPERRPDRCRPRRQPEQPAHGTLLNRSHSSPGNGLMSGGRGGAMTSSPILVTGGTGTLGQQVVSRLRVAGRDVRVLQPAHRRRPRHRRPDHRPGAPGGRPARRDDRALREQPEGRRAGRPQPRPGRYPGAPPSPAGHSRTWSTSRSSASTGFRAGTSRPSSRPNA